MFILVPSLNFLFFFLGSNKIHGLLVTGALLDQRSPAASQRAPLAQKEKLQSQCAAAHAVQEWVQPHVAKPNYCPASTFHSLLPNHKECLRLLPVLLGAGPCTALQLFAMDINKLLMPYINKGRNCTLILYIHFKTSQVLKMNTWLGNHQIMCILYVYFYCLHCLCHIYFIWAFCCILTWIDMTK